MPAKGHRIWPPFALLAPLRGHVEPGLPRRLWLAALAAVVTVSLACLLRPAGDGRLPPYPASVQILDREGQPLRIVLGSGDARCDPIALEAAGDWAAKAIVAVEDKRFFRHHGLDPIAIVRAAAQNLWRRRVVSGASTLSTQIIRLTTPRPRTLPTKITEAAAALKMERSMTKAEILEQYLNRAPFGSNLVGLQAASRRYFGKDASDLTLAEASLLMGLPQSPSRLRPDRHLPAAVRRQDTVLRRMLAAGFITEKQLREAESQRLVIRGAAGPFDAPHFCDLVLVARRSARVSLPPSPLGQDVRSDRRPTARPPALRTTLDSRLQRLAEEALRQHAPDPRNRGIAGGAVVILEVRTGAVRALVGSPDYHDDARAGRVNGACALRSPGSALKPFAYAMAFDRGLCTPATALADVPIQFRDYRPGDFGGKFTGLTTARRALVESLNIPALTLGRQVGLAPLVEELRQLGLSTLDQPAEHYGLSVVLGTAEVRLLDLANAYACLARLGRYFPYRLIETDPIRAPVAIFSPEAAYLVADILGGEERALAATGNAADAKMPRIAWKTGTSSGCRDAWTLAYNPEYVVGVWFGNPDGSPAQELVGIEAAAPVACNLLRRLYPDGTTPWFERPPGIRKRKVCAISGRCPNPGCADLVDDWAIAGVSDPGECGVHRRDPATGRVRESWAPAIAQGLRQLGLHTDALADTVGLDRLAGRSPEIVSPQPDAVYRRLEGVRLTQTVDLAAVGAAPDTDVFWFVDGVAFGKCRAADRLPWPLTRGPHAIACVDARGRADRIRITVE